MNLTVYLPDAIANQLSLNGPQASRCALEMFALEGYRSNKLIRGKVGALLELSFYETEEFLKKNEAEIKLTLEEFQRGADALDRLIA